MKTKYKGHRCAIASYHYVTVILLSLTPTATRTISFQQSSHNHHYYVVFDRQHIAITLLTLCHCCCSTRVVRLYFPLYAIHVMLITFLSADPKCDTSPVSVAAQPTMTTVTVCPTPTQVGHVSSTAVTQHPYCPGT